MVRRSAPSASLAESSNSSLILCARVQPDRDSAFAEWRLRWQTAILESPGAVNVEYWPPTPPDQVEAVAAARFESVEALRQWRRSNRNRELIADAEALVEGQIVVQLCGQAASEYDTRSSTTEVIITDIKPGLEEAYRAWFARIQKVQETFPGYLGSFVQPPRDKERGWTTVLRFDTSEHLEGWLDSAERAKLLSAGEDLILGFHAQRVDASFPGWTPIDPATGQSPNKWKTAALVLLTLFPVVMLELRFLSPLLRGLNSAAGTFIGNTISIALTTWPLMPLATRVFNGWLFPRNTPRWLVLTSPIALLICYALEFAAFWRLP